MPLYSYECSVCNKQNDVLQRLGDLPPEACEECGAVGSLNKIISSTTFQLKGDGWYKDLYGNKPPGEKR